MTEKRILFPHEKHTLSLLPRPLSRIELYKLSPRVEFLPQKAIMGLRSPIKKRIRLSDIY